MRASAELFSSLVSCIYDAALDATLWEPMLRNLVATFDGSCGALLINKGPSRSALYASVGQDHASVATYNAYYSRIDPFASAVEKMSAGSVSHGWDIVAPGECRRSEFFNDWADPNGLDDCVFASLARDGDRTAWLGIGGGIRAKPFYAPDKVCLLQLLVPHLQRALNVQSSLGTIELQHRRALKAFDCLAHGVVLFDAEGSILFANRAAESIAATGGLVLARTGLHAIVADDNAALQRLLGQAIGKQPGGLRAGGSLALARPSARQPLVLHILPTNAGEEELPMSGALALIVDPEREPQALAEVLRHVYGLTRAEATVACEVSRGDGLQPVADKMAISLSTVRVHLQRVFEKTCTHRQAELARLLLMIEAAVAPRDDLP